MFELECIKKAKILNSKTDDLINELKKFLNAVKSEYNLTNIDLSGQKSLRQLIRLIPQKPPVKLPDKIYGNTTIFISNYKVLISGGVKNTKQVTNDNYVYNLVNATRSSKTRLPEAVTNHSAVVIDNNNILFSGGLKGIDSGTRTLVNTVYNLTSNAYTSKRDLRKEKERHSANNIDGSVYLLGGFEGTGIGIINNKHVCFNYAANTFSAKPTSTAFAGHSTSNTRNSTFSFGYLIWGGITNINNTVTNKCSTYWTDTNTFENKVNMLNNRAFLTNVDLKNMTVLIAGGIRDASNYCLGSSIYSVENDTYTAKANLLEGKCYLTGIYIANNHGAILFGGKNDELGSDKIDYYNVAENKYYRWWKT